VYNGHEAGIDLCTVMGNELVGRVVDVGADISKLQIGDRVVASFSTACGRCAPCRRGLSARCEVGQLFGWREAGVGLHGAQAQLLRVPLADSTLVKLSADLPPEVALLLGDVLPTGYYGAQRAGITPGDDVVVLGCGPIGLMAIFAALAQGAKRVFAFDAIAERLAFARRLGAIAIDFREADAHASVLDATDGGVAAAIEAVGNEAASDAAYALLRPGGTLSIVGVHNEAKLSLSPAQLYDKNVTVRMGRCPARSLMPKLLPLLEDAQSVLRDLTTHRLTLDEGPGAYEMFAARSSGCLKVVFHPND
jgi:threonine dehydrogenase-like Zn-dependent dehydrogenase